MGLMAVSEAVKVERVRARAAQRAQNMDLVKKAIDNPVVEFAALLIVLEAWYRYKASRPGVNPTALDIDALLLWGSGTTILTAHQLAPIMPDLLRGAGDFAKSVLPLLGTAAAAAAAA